jgi:hypothetical protein
VFQNNKLLILLFSLLTFAWQTFASSGITYQGRLLKPDGTPVTSSTVQFRLQMRTPGAEDCLLYEEIQTADLSLTSGVFALSIGDGSGVRQDTHHTWTLFEALSNRKDFTFTPGDCIGMNSYSPDPGDNRKFRVAFDLGSGWETLPVQTINYIPMSIETYAVGGFPASSLLRVEDAGALVNTAPLSNAQYVELLALLGGSSGQYEHAGQLGGSALPSLGAGQTMVSDGSGGWSAALPLTSESDPTVQAFAQTALPTCTTGEALVSNGTTLSCVSVASGSLSESDIPKLTSAGNGVDGGAISGEIGGSTSVNTSGDLATTGDITASGNVSAGSISTGSLSATGGITSTGDISVTGVGGKVSATNGEFRRLHLLDDQATPHYVEVRSPDPLTANYTLTLPGSLGSANQILGMNNAGNALENKTLTAGTGVTITHSAGGIEIAASGSGGTVTSVTGMAPIIVDNSDPNTPIVTLDDSGVGVGTYGSATEVPVITVDVKGRITSASNTTISGVSPTGSNLATGKAWIGDGTGKAAEAYINVSDLKRSSDGAPQFPTTCNSGEALTWSSVIDVFTCSSITITKSQISDFPTLGNAALEDVGTNAGDVVQLDPSGKLPAVDGSQLTNLTLPSYDTTYFKQGGNDFSATATLGTTGNNDLNIITNNTTKMTVLANGNVGIGTTNPSSTLQIQSGNLAVMDGTGLIQHSSSTPSLTIRSRQAAGYAPSTLFLNRVGASSAATPDNSSLGEVRFDGLNTALGYANFAMISASSGTNSTAGAPGNLKFSTSDGGASAIERMRIDSDGRVGIGTSNPADRVDISGPDNTTALRIKDGNTALRFALNATATYIQSTKNSGGSADLIFSENGGANEKMRIKADGKVGIGTTTPLVSLDVGNKTDAIRVPVGATLDQPSSVANGMIRYNSDNNKFEAYENGAWTNMIGGSASSASSVAAGAGSAATPSISFSADADTGFYSSGTNSIGISAGGAKVWDITSSGIVSPTAGGASIATAAGTAAAPTFSFAGDTDTGWYLAAPDTLAASTGGVERVRINSSGNVGIGTTNPTTIGDGDTPKILRVHQTGGQGVLSLTTDNTSSSSWAGSVSFGTTGASGTKRSAVISSVLTGVSTTNAIGDLRFFTSDGTTMNTNMIISATGNVGIGTTNPSSRLHVAASTAGNVVTVSDDDKTWIQGIEGGAQNTYSIWEDTTSGSNNRLSFVPGGNIIMGINGGNVGIGTPSPGTKLHVVDSSAANKATLVLEAAESSSNSARMVLKSSSSTKQWDIAYKSSTNTVYPHDSMVLQYYDGSSYKSNLVLDPNGNVGIGVNKPLATLHVGGSSDVPGDMLRIGSWGAVRAPATGSGALTLDYYNGSSWSQGMVLNTSGNVGIGTATPTAPLDVNGKIRGVASVGFDSSSTTLSVTGSTSVYASDISTSVAVQANDLVKVDLACNLRNDDPASTTYMAADASSSPGGSWIMMPNWITVAGSDYAGGSSTGLYKATANGTVTFQALWHVGSGTGHAVYCNIIAYVIGKQ